MERLNRREHVVDAFFDVKKAFDSVWHNGLRYKIFMLHLPTKMTCCRSDFLVGRVIQVNVNGFLSDKISPIAGVPQGSVLSPLLFLIYVYVPNWGGGGRVAGSEDFACYTLPTIPLDFQREI